MEPAEFTLTLKGNPDEVSRVLRATMLAYRTIEEEGRRVLDELYRLNLGDRYIHPTGPFSSLEGTLTLKNADAALLGWH